MTTRSMRAGERQRRLVVVAHREAAIAPDEQRRRRRSASAAAGRRGSGPSPTHARRRPRAPSGRRRPRAPVQDLDDDARPGPQRPRRRAQRNSSPRMLKVTHRPAVEQVAAPSRCSSRRARRGRRARRARRPRSRRAGGSRRRAAAARPPRPGRRPARSTARQRGPHGDGSSAVARPRKRVHRAAARCCARPRPTTARSARAARSGCSRADVVRLGEVVVEVEERPVVAGRSRGCPATRSRSTLSCGPTWSVVAFQPSW